MMTIRLTMAAAAPLDGGAPMMIKADRLILVRAQLARSCIGCHA